MRRYQLHIPRGKCSTTSCNQPHMRLDQGLRMHNVPGHAEFHLSRIKHALHHLIPYYECYQHYCKNIRSNDVQIAWTATRRQAEISPSPSSRAQHSNGMQTSHCVKLHHWEQLPSSRSWK